MLHIFGAAKSLAEHFLLVLILLKMMIVRRRTEENSGPGTCRHSELHIAMGDGQAVGDCVEKLGG